MTRPINDGKRYGERRYYVFVGGPPPPPSTATPPEGLRWKVADTLARELALVHGVAGLYTTERPQWDRSIWYTFYKLDPPWPGWRWYHARTYRRPGFIDNTGWYGGVLPGTPEPPSSLAVHKPATFFSPKSPAAAKRLYEQNYARNKGKKRAKPKAEKPAKAPKPPKPKRVKVEKPLTRAKVEAHTPAVEAPRAVPPIKRPRPSTTPTP